MRTAEDPYAGKVSLGKLVRTAAAEAVHDEEADAELQRVNDILVGEKYVSILADAGCMITRIPTQGAQQFRAAVMEAWDQYQDRLLVGSPGRAAHMLADDIEKLLKDSGIAP
jgi:hypothetical protein